MKLINIEKEIDLINTIIRNHENNKQELEQMKQKANANLAVRYFFKLKHL